MTMFTGLKTEINGYYGNQLVNENFEIDNIAERVNIQKIFLIIIICFYLSLYIVNFIKFIVLFPRWYYEFSDLRK